MEDDGVFTMRWSATITYWRSFDQWREFVCAESLRATHVIEDSANEKDTSAPIAGAQVRLGAYRAATGPLGLAEVDMPKGVYDLDIWKVGYKAPTMTVRLDNDMLIKVQAVLVPEEDPDAMWQM